MARRAQQNQLQSAHFPAPTGGINSADAGGSLPVTDAVACNNMIAGQYGLQTRLGYREWVTGLAAPVRTLMPFHAADPDNDALFAVTPAGVQVVTDTTATPASAFAFPSSAGSAGFGVFTAYTTSAGHFLFYADEVNGLHLYKETTGTWAACVYGVGVGEISGVDPADVAFVTVWKNRIWFVKRATGTAYYLPVGQIAGVATAFEFGNKFSAGGTLVGLWSWTADGGSGIDDMLVAISTGGDVLVYQGTDPDTAADFAMRGTWYIGAPPAGRRIATSFGGELLVLTRQGVLPMSRLLSGQPLNPAIYSTRKIASLFGAEMAQSAETVGWSMPMHSADQALLITSPGSTGSFSGQFAMSLNTGGWSTFTGIPMLSACEWEGAFYFGSLTGIVYEMTGSYDNVDRAGGTSLASPVDGEGVTSFQSLGSTRRKNVALIHSHFLSINTAPAYAVEARYEFDRSAVAQVPTGDFAIGSLWDVMLWDVGTWTDDVLTPSGLVRGAVGIGSSVAVAWKIRAATRTTLVGFDVSWRTAGLM